MKLENQVCTLEQAKKLNDLGVVQCVSLFFYDSEAQNKVTINTHYEREEKGCYGMKFCFSAFTVAELGVMMPLMEAQPYYTTLGGWITEIEEIDDAHERVETEAEARGWLLIHCIETGRIDVERVNANLLTA